MIIGGQRLPNLFETLSRRPGSTIVGLSTNSTAVPGK
jgi:hypothetical protein